jgi:hypothetical protein
MIELRPYRGRHTTNTRNYPTWIVKPFNDIWFVMQQKWIQPAVIFTVGGMSAMFGVALFFFLPFVVDFPGLFGMLQCVLFMLLPLVFGFGAVYGLVWHTMRRLRQVIGPATLHASTDVLDPGDTFTLDYRHPVTSGFYLQLLSFRLVLRESATYTVGTDTYTYTDTHEHIIQGAACQARPIAANSVITEEVTLTIPPDAIHTFIAPHNRLEWVVAVVMAFDVWPHTYRRLYQLTVNPEVHIA